MTKKTPISAITMLLLYSVALVGITNAFASNLEIAYAHVSDKRRNPTKTAGCLIVLSTRDSSTPNIYCRYELGTDEKFLRDDDNGIKLSNVKLYRSSDQTKFQDKIAYWFGEQYPNMIPAPDEISKIAKMMSRTKDKLNRFNQPQTYRLVLARSSNISTNRKFAAAVHSLIIKTVAENKKTAVAPKTVPGATASRAEQVRKFAAERAAERANKVAAEKANKAAELANLAAEKANLAAEKANKTAELANLATEKANTSAVSAKEAQKPAGLGLFMITIVVIIVSSFVLLWFLLTKRYSHLENKLEKLETNLSVNLTDINKKMAMQSQLQKSRQASQQNGENLQKQLDFLRSEQEKLRNTLSPEPSEPQIGQETLTKTLEEQLHLENASDEIKTLNQHELTLQNVLSERFLLHQPENADFSQWITALIKQTGVWRWLQPALLGEQLVCEHIVNYIKENGSEKDHQILELLHFDSIMTHWVPLVGQAFDSNDQLFAYLRDIDGGNWLNGLLSAHDVLQSYFHDEKSFKLLSQHLSNVSGILRAAFVEMGITFKNPKILEEVPSYVPGTNYVYTSSPRLKALVKPQVQKRLKEVDKPFVVNVERYGFVTADNPNAVAEVRVFVSSQAEWE